MLKNWIHFGRHLIRSALAQIRSGIGDIGTVLTSLRRTAGESGKVKFSLATLFRLPGRFFRQFKKSRGMQMLAAVLVLAVLGAGTILYFEFDKARRTERVRALATTNLEQQKFATAARQFEELESLNGSLDTNESRQYFEAVLQTGDEARLKETLAKLAPESGLPGIEAAHRFMAIELAKQVQFGGENQLRRLRWHLEHSGDDESADLALARGRYFLAIGEPDLGTQQLKQAARLNPVYLLNVALIHEQSGDKIQWKLTLEEANSILAKSLEQSPEVAAIRMAYSEVLLKLGRYDECDQVLKSAPVGSHEFSKARSDLFLRRYCSSEMASFEERLALLIKALELSIENQQTHLALLKFYGKQSDEQKKRRIYEAVDNLPSDGGHIAFLKGTMHAMENDADKALEFGRITIDSSPNDHRHQHLFAWALSRVKNADLATAEEYARAAVLANKSHPVYRMTLGQILAALGKHEEATVELQQALVRSRNQLSNHQLRTIHESLFKSYELLQQYELSDAHAKQYLKRE